MLPNSIASNNHVRHLGSLVQKKLLSRYARRRFWSEILTREYLVSLDIAHIPLKSFSEESLTITMPNVLEEKEVGPIPPSPAVLAQEVLSLSKKMWVHKENVASSYWLDQPESVIYRDSFSHFIQLEVEKHLSAHGKDFLSGMDEEVLSMLADCPPCPSNFLCLLDVSPKNVFVLKAGICHFDFEGTIIGPRDYFLARTALNFMRDYSGNPCDLKATAMNLISHCSDERVVKSAIAYTLTRMLLYNAIENKNSYKPVLALRALCRDSFATVLSLISHV